jgi:hypothetical protein
MEILKSTFLLAALLLSLTLMALGCGAGDSSEDADGGKALQIVSVSFGPRETVMGRRMIFLVAKIKNGGTAPADLYLARNTGEKFVREEADTWREMTPKELADVGKPPDFGKMAYGLGLEAGHPAKGKWYFANTGYRWVPSDGPRDDLPEQVRMAPGSVRSFQILVPDKGELFGDESYRPFIINPSFVRIDEKILQRQ